MYNLIRESEFKFRITTKNDWQKMKKRKLKDRSSDDSIHGYLECSSDDSLLLNEIKNNLTANIPKVNLERISNNHSTQPETKKIKIMESKQILEKINVLSLCKLSKEVIATDSLTSEKDNVISSTPNTSTFHESDSESLNTTSKMTKNMSLISPINPPNTTSFIKIFNDNAEKTQNGSNLLDGNKFATENNDIFDENQNCLEKMSNSKDPFMINCENSTYNFSAKVNQTNFLDIVESSEWDRETCQRMFQESEILDLSDEQMRCLKVIEEEFDSSRLESGPQVQFEQNELDERHELNEVNELEEDDQSNENEYQICEYQICEYEFENESNNSHNTATTSEQLDSDSDKLQDRIHELKAKKQEILKEIHEKCNDSDPDYIPEEENNFSASESFNVVLTDNREEKETALVQNATIVIEENIIAKGFDVSLPLPQATTSEVTRPKVYVSASKSGPKKHACLFCGKLFFKIARHLEVHKDEEEVKKFLLLKPNDQVRLDLIRKLRHAGDYKHNTNINPAAKNHERIVIRRPKVGVTKNPSDFAYCPSCQVSVSKSTLSTHFVHCTGQTGKSRRVIKKMSKIYENDFHPETSKKLRSLLVCMHVDEVSKTIKFDDLLIKFGNTLCEKYKLAQHDEMIRNRLRLLARLLVTVKKVEMAKIKDQKEKKLRVSKPSITDMISLFDPEKVQICLKAVNIIAGIDTKTYNARAPSVASLVGTLLKQLGDFLIAENIMDKQKNKNDDVKDFLHVINRKWADVINKNVEEAQSKQKRKKKEELPSTDDINKLMDHLVKLQSQAYDELVKKFSADSYDLLAKTTLIRVQLFNRRRPGETERILLEDFEMYDRLSEDTHKDIMKTLSDKAREFCKKYVRFSIRGKKNRQVSVILDEVMFDSINLLIKNRLNAGIHPQNPFVFGLPGFSSEKHKYLRACTLMRKFSEDCKAEFPKKLRATKLRKHIATYLVNHNINNVERSKIASHLGHSMGVHENYYHLINVAEEICQLPQVLEDACGLNNNNMTNDKNSAESSDNDLDSDSDSDSDLSDADREKKNCSLTLESEKLDTNEESNLEISIPCRRMVWSNLEITALKEHFGDKIKSRTYPNSKEMNAVRMTDPRLKKREVPAIRSWFSNFYKKLKKNSQ
ncbi:uncharacterized protein LOC130666089 isoform X1 [Microplitis mediator]|uniref:uncharacterized protein LOC130666089 isoform X1 n=2 Tax=Microplitis mediator TaxID=375433 RepID=UPI00255544EC|nr:uncharacterized protein LOC130666089 isoform X1 [Microplitis mediator]